MPSSHTITPLLSFNEVCAHGTVSESSMRRVNNRTTTADTLANFIPANKASTDIAKADKTSKLTDIAKQAQIWLASLPPKTLSAQSHTERPLLLDKVSGQLWSGQLTVLLGPSGSGKSVLLRLLAGLTPISSGDICVNDISIFDTTPTHWRAQVALLGQHPQLLDGSVLDNLQLPYTLSAHQNRQFNKQWHLQQLSYLQRDEQLLYQSTTYLSGGERQLVNILRLLQLDPQVLLLDEPTAALDPQTAANLIKLLVDWLHDDPNRAILWITHDSDTIMPFADNCWHMQTGKLTELSSAQFMITLAL